MSRKVERIREVARVFKPRGWKLVEKPSDGKTDGCADMSTRTITCPPLVTEYALFVYLHEVGHVRCGHLLAGQPGVGWLEEYEAEMWAMAAMRAVGFRITREMMNNARENVRHHLLWADMGGAHVEYDRKIVMFAFPDTWRDFI